MRSRRWILRTPAIRPNIPVVLFVCIENSFRSVMAEAFFNARAPPGWRAISAGVDASGRELNPRVVPVMRDVGLDVTRKRPQQVTREMIRDAWRVITFHCVDRCPAGAMTKNEDWSIPGATGKTEAELREIRDEVKRHVLDLIQRLPPAEA